MINVLDSNYFLERCQIDENGCWIWKHSINKSGHGTIGKDITGNVWHESLAHRLAYRVMVGDIPEGDEIRHTCDISMCCNPDHLFPSSNHRKTKGLDVDYFTERILQNETGCWVWQQYIDEDGYGRVGLQISGNVWQESHIHRLAYRVLKGDIPNEYEVHHTCRNRACCNPEHLELKHEDEHAHDNGHNLKTHCPAGHPYSGNNLYLEPNGGRKCRTCMHEQRKRNL